MASTATDALEMSLDDIITTQRGAKRQAAANNRPKKAITRTAPYPEQRKASVASQADKLVVSNLATTVTQADVKELFARIDLGPIKSAQLNYNADGKSKGVANVLFARSGDAHKAYTEYHNRPLDNRPMKIELVINPETVKVRLESRLGKSATAPAKRVGKVGKGVNNKRAPKKDVTAMDLDADMDAYMTSDVSGGNANLAAALN